MNKSLLKSLWKQTVEGNDWSCSRPESRHEINKENLVWGQSGNETLKNLNRSIRSKTPQCNISNGRETLRYWRHNERKIS